MILVIMNWLWIGTASFLLGFGALAGMGKITGEDRFKSVEMYILTGLLCLTVYSQIFSLAAGVGAAAAFGVGIACVAAAVLLRTRLKHYFKYLYTHILQRKGTLLLIPLVLLLLLLTVYLTAGHTWHYDTDLYHAQAIRWIEEYGVVKGLGNLHNRFAYNSSFFCLQALFSMKFITNQSLHTMNGFITFLMLSYALCTLSIWKRESVKTSDFLKAGLFLYFGYLENPLVVSSPGSDLPTLCMVLYISAKWAELVEQKEKTPAPYGILCLFAVWTVTMKLSAAPPVLLALYPAALLVRRKNWKQLLFFLLAGTGIVIPFLVRNVIISGYLVYPYSAVDLFNVDWKMAASLAADDSREIMAWGRGLTDRSLYGAGFRIWFPRWYENLAAWGKALFLANIVSMVISAVYLVRAVFRKGETHWASLLLLLVSMVQAVMWFVTAPLIRYGLAYMLLTPLFLLGLVCRKAPLGIPSWVICAAGIYCGISCMLHVAADFTEPFWKRPADYNWKECSAVKWENMDVYVPVSGDCGGYHFFPGTPNSARLEYIELRTGKTGDGFRLKAAYREKQFISSGTTVE